MPPRSVLLNITAKASYGNLKDAAVKSSEKEIEPGNNTKQAPIDTAALVDDGQKADPGSQDPVTPIEGQSCTTCSKSSAALSKPLLRCSRCQSAYYCSKDCQRLNWKAHKKICGPTSPGSGPNSVPNSIPGTPRSALSPTSPSALLANLGFDLELQALQKEDVFTYLVDAYRLCDGGDFKLNGTARKDSLYEKDEPEPLEDFRSFLMNAEKCDGILPEWWNSQARAECITFALAEGWSNLQNAIGKSDVALHYDDPVMVTKLRNIGERIHG